MVGVGHLPDIFVGNILLGAESVDCHVHCIAQGYVKIPDLMDTLRQEYGVDLRECGLNDQ